MKWFTEESSKVDTADQNIPNRIKEIHICSDGAASHFKQKGTLRFLYFFIKQFGFSRLTWTFGCPGHGKGTL
jgi:hypothetical protein